MSLRLLQHSVIFLNHFSRLKHVITLFHFEQKSSRVKVILLHVGILYRSIAIKDSSIDNQLFSSNTSFPLNMQFLDFNLSKYLEKNKSDPFIQVGILYNFIRHSSTDILFIFLESITLVFTLANMQDIKYYPLLIKASTWPLKLDIYLCN